MLLIRHTLAFSHTRARNGGYYGPNGRFGLVGSATEVAPPRAANGPTLASSLWTVAAAETRTDLPH